MKKTLLIALCSLAVLFAACTKPEPEPTPEPVDYTADYIGDYLGQFTLTITSMNNQEQTGMAFPIDGIGMVITKGSENNALIASMTVDDQTHQAMGTANNDKAIFDPLHLVIDETHQLSNPYLFNLDLQLEGTKAASDTLNITGSFTGNGSATFMGQEQIFEEVSGTLTGKLVKQ